MDYGLFKKLHAEGLITSESLIKIEEREAHPVFSVYWEVKTLLYIGILLLTTGLGILVYKNIDSIGHQAVLAFIALVSIGCFAWCFKHKPPFKRTKTQAAKSFFYYILLLAATSFLIFVGYLQYQYKVFGLHYGMAAFIPMLVLFYLAYDFDHLGVLSMAIINLGIWMGLSVTPQQLLTAGTFKSNTIVFTCLCLGVILLAAAMLTEKYIFKAHFKFSYQHYGIHVCFIALLAGYFLNYDSNLCLLWLFSLFGLAAYILSDALKQKSFYFSVLTVLYVYMATSCLMARLLTALPGGSGIWFMFYYFIGSAIGFVYLLIYLNKKLKAA